MTKLCNVGIQKYVASVGMCANVTAILIAKLSKKSKFAAKFPRLILLSNYD